MDVDIVYVYVSVCVCFLPSVVSVFLLLQIWSKCSMIQVDVDIVYVSCVVWLCVSVLCQASQTCFLKIWNKCSVIQVDVDCGCGVHMRVCVCGVCVYVLCVYVSFFQAPQACFCCRKYGVNAVLYKWTLTLCMWCVQFWPCTHTQEHTHTHRTAAHTLTHI